MNGEFKFGKDKFVFQLGRNSQDELLEVSSKPDSGGTGYEAVELNGYMNIAAGPCGYAATYKTIRPIIQTSNADDYPVGGEVEIKIDGGRTYTVEYDQNGNITVDGVPLDEEKALKNIEAACGGLYDDDDDW